MPLALISASSRSVASFGPKLLGMLVNRSVPIAYAPHSQILQRVASDQNAAGAVDMKNAFRHLGRAEVKYAAARKRLRAPRPELAVGYKAMLVNHAGAAQNVVP